MAALRPEVKAFIVTALACFDTPTQVAEAVREEFGIEITRMHVAGYDPSKSSALSKKWRDLFEKTRKEFSEKVAEIPIAQRAFRLRVMQRTLTKAEVSRNSMLVLQTLEQAAKETGDAYVNRQRPVGGEDGDEPVATKVERGVKDARRHDNG